MKLRMAGYPDLEVPDFKTASEVFGVRREESGQGASEFADGEIWADGQAVARISYNGRVWSPAPYMPGDIPLYDNRIP